MRELMERVRRIVLDSDARLDECIMWSTATFTYRGAPVASVFQRGSMYATLVFHKAELLPVRFEHLDWAPHRARSMQIVSIAEAEWRREEIAQVIAAWIEWHSEASGPA